MAQQASHRAVHQAARGTTRRTARGTAQETAPWRRGLTGGHGSQHGVLARLNTDGRPHPLVNGLASVAAVCGLVAIATAAVTQLDWADLHLIASWTGMAGVVAGVWGQFISVTRAERFVLVIGLGLAAVGLYLGMAFGGPFGGLIG